MSINNMSQLIPTHIAKLRDQAGFSHLLGALASLPRKMLATLQSTSEFLGSKE